MRRESCATVIKAISTIRTSAEMDGFTWGLRNLKGAMRPTRDEWAAIARRKIELQKRERNGSIARTAQPCYKPIAAVGSSIPLTRR